MPPMRAALAVVSSVRTCLLLFSLPQVTKQRSLSSCCTRFVHTQYHLNSIRVTQTQSGLQLWVERVLWRVTATAGRRPDSDFTAEELTSDGRPAPTAFMASAGLQLLLSRSLTTTIRKMWIYSRRLYRHSPGAEERKIQGWFR